jgi:hypothetical protein
MRRWSTFIAIVVITAAPVVGARTTSPTVPRLLRTMSSRRHVVVVARIAEGATPNLVEVSRTPTLVGAHGFTLGGVVLRESIAAVPGPSGLLRVVTEGRVRSGRYWVAISTDDVGLTSCQPLRLRGNGDCLAAWSNVLRLVVP